MSNQAQPVFGLITEATIDAIGTARSVFSEPTVLELGRAAADVARVEAAILALEADVLALAGVRSHDDFCRLLRTWGDDLVELAVAVLAPLAPLAVAGEPLVEALIIKVIGSKFPRLETLLSAAGVFVENPIIGSSVDWERLRDLLLNGPGVVNEDFWDSFVDAADPTSGKIPALLAALLVVVPQAAGLRTGDLRIAGLDPPPVAPGSPAWAKLRADSDGWIPVTIPLQTEGTKLKLPPPPDLAAGFDPELAMSLLFRSQRRASGGRTVTDFEMWVYPSKDDKTFELPLSGGSFVRVEPSVPIGLGYDGTAGTWNAAIAPRPGSTVDEATNDAVISIGKEDEEGKPDLLLGAPDETRLIVRDLSLDLRLRETGEPSVELVGRAHGFAVVVTNRWFRSLGAGSALRDGLRLDLDLDARLAEGSGLSIAVEGALETRIQVGKQFKVKGLVLRIHSVLVRVPIRADTQQFDIRAEVIPHWSVSVGAVNTTLVVDGAGGWVGWWAEPAGSGKECIGLLPPTGLGLQVEFPGWSAGGFVDFTGGPNYRYGGLVSVTIKPPDLFRGVTVTAFCLHELAGKPTDADRDVTFILVLGTKFLPGVMFGPGIVWDGIGGLYGHNRRADTDALRERLTAGAVGNVLFADDPVRNAPVLLGDLAALFPPASGVQVFGLTGQFGWIQAGRDYLIRAAVGVIVEYNQRISRVVILGSLMVRIPGEPGNLEQQEKLDKLLFLQLDVVGDIDPVRHTLAIDATIVRGQALDLFTLTGDGAVRASYGDQPYLMATAGGFHPNFHPEPAVFPPLKRIQLTLKSGDKPDAVVKISASAYLAVTTSTVQFGAELDASVKVDGWKIEGKIGGDGLIVLQPFSFDISVFGGVHVKYRFVNLLGIDFKGGLAGPSPLVLRGEVCVSVLFSDWCWGGSIELGGGVAVAGRVIGSLVPIVAEELANLANLVVAGGDDVLVLVTTPAQTARPVLSPLQAPGWSQNRVPLGLPVETFEDGHLDEPQRLTVSASRPTTPQLDWFSPGSFVALTDAEEMALPSFEQHQAGVLLSANGPRSVSVSVQLEVIEIRLPGQPKPPKPGFGLPDHVLDRLDAVTGAVTVRSRPGRFEIHDQGLNVDAAGTLIAAGVTAVQARLVARTVDAAVTHPADRLVEV